VNLALGDTLVNVATHRDTSPTVRLTTFVDPALAAEVERRAREGDRSIAAEVRRLLRERFEGKRP
jgi:hypothetical protein